MDPQNTPQLTASDVSSMIEQALNNREKYNTTNLSLIPAHTHNGTDALQVSGETLNLIDSTLNDVNSSRHGFVPKAPFYIDLTTTTYNNDTTQDVLYTIPIKGGTLGTNHAIKGTIWISNLSQNGIAEIPTMRFKYGSTTFSTNDCNTYASGPFQGYFTFYIFANGSTNSQKGQISIQAGKITPSSSVVPFIYAGSGTAAEDSNVDKNAYVTWQNLNANINNSITVSSLLVEKIY